MVDGGPRLLHATLRAPVSLSVRKINLHLQQSSNVCHKPLNIAHQELDHCGYGVMLSVQSNVRLAEPDVPVCPHFRYRRTRDAPVQQLPPPRMSGGKTRRREGEVFLRERKYPRRRRRRRGTVLQFVAVVVGKTGNAAEANGSVAVGTGSR